MNSRLAECKVALHRLGRLGFRLATIGFLPVQFMHNSSQSIVQVWLSAYQTLNRCADERECNYGVLTFLGQEEIVKVTQTLFGASQICMVITSKDQALKGGAFHAVLSKTKETGWLRMPQRRRERV